MRRVELKNDVWGIALGLFAAVSQVVLLRESLSLASGNELSTGVSFAGWFLGVATGALAARYTVRVLDRPLPAAIVAGILVAAGFLLLRLHRVWLGLGPGQTPSLATLTGVLILCLGLGGAAIGNLFTQTALRFSDDLSTPVSRLFVAESVGSVLGAILFYFVMAEALPHLTCLAVVFGVLLLAGAVVAGGRERVVASALFITVCVSTLTGISSIADLRLDVQAFESLSRSPVVASAQTPYGRLSLTEADGQFELWTDGRLDYVFPDPYERAVSVHVAMTEHPNPKDVLLLGGGPSDRLAAALAHHPKRVVLTYLNPGIERLCHAHWSRETLDALGDPRVQTVNEDGRRFAAVTRERFDVIIVSSPPPRSAGENRFHTVSFYRDLGKILNPGGIVAVIAPGGANVLSKEVTLSAASTLATLRSVFSETVIVPGLKTLILGTNEKGVLTQDAAVLAARYRDRGVHAASFSERRFADLLNPGRMRNRREALARAPARINTDEMPIIYASNLGAWERSLGSASENAARETATGFVLRHAQWLFIVPLILSGVWLVLSRKSRNAAGARALLSLGVTGAAGMAGQIVIMLAFQTAMGTLYSAVALLSGSFMLGLTLGGTAARRMFATGRPRDALIVDGISILFLFVTGFLLGRVGDASWAYFAWSGAAGAVTGAAFPLYLSISAKSAAGDERASAVAVEIADHLGALFGAFVTGFVWIPSYGLTVTCLLFAVLKGVTAVSWIRR